MSDDEEVPYGSLGFSGNSARSTLRGLWTRDWEETTPPRGVNSLCGSLTGVAPADSGLLTGVPVCRGLSPDRCGVRWPT